ncbi:MAG: hypothetical protein MUE85_20390 [Microscillaceae bacterium]|nr:hypothetical protein [Microscillaceae bacterium]
MHFKFTTYHPLLRRGQGEAKEMRKFEMHPFKFTTYHPLLRRGQGEAKEMRKFEMHPFTTV